MPKFIRLSSTLCLIKSIGALSVLIAFTAAPVCHAALYATGEGGLFNLNASTGVATAVGLPPLDANIHEGGLAYDPLTGAFYATGYDNASQSAFYTLNPVTGAATKIAEIPANLNINIEAGGLAFDTKHRVLYATGTDGHQGTAFFSINPVDGVLTRIGTEQRIDWTASIYGFTPVSLYGIGYDPSTDTLYANGTTLFADAGLGSSLFTIDRTTGQPTRIGYAGVIPGRSLGYSGLAYDPDTAALYSLGSITGGTYGLYTINTGTGHATLVSTQSPIIGADGGLAFVSAVPEPSTYLAGALLLLPFGLQGIRHLRSRKQAA